MAHSPLEEILSQAVNVQMPQLDQEMEDGAVVQWLKAAGDPVAQGEVIAEIETDKAIVEVDAPASGVLRSIDVPAGEVVPVGTTLAVIEVDAAQPAQPSDAPRLCLLPQALPTTNMKFPSVPCDGLLPPARPAVCGRPPTSTLSPRST